MLGHRDPDRMQLGRAAPTPLSTTLMIVLQVCASVGLVLCLGDVSTACMQGERTQRRQGRLYASCPQEGLPGVPPGCLDEVLTAVYGLLNAPAHWRKTLRSALESLGYRGSALDPCLFILHAKTEDKTPVAGLVLTDVDDIACAGTTRHQKLMEQLRARLRFVKWVEREGYYNGRYIVHHP